MRTLTGTHPAGTRALLAAMLALAVPLLAGCVDADTLGDEPPTVVQVGDPPTWKNGVGELMQLKCGVCHTVPPNDLSPDNTPNDFDLNYHVTSPLGVPGAVRVIPDIQGGILKASAEKDRMPPLYATPLVPSEIKALKDWADGGGL